jgi:hypothetical protein
MATHDMMQTWQLEGMYLDRLGRRKQPAAQAEHLKSDRAVEAGQQCYVGYYLCSGALPSKDNYCSTYQLL